ncbi:hypothetical protein DUNSADRAFT_1198 [Dunaliella salina]|uniref:Uncharacterized protein n=1 Tax=Dunaliella salina TaxID=3046 RepID=A0ABQ7FXV4_DUNSA|nr:hypothetical protein DUNSADRAFT_1198 [Dunaliella salina]|eukprot:KAF5827171.1 hypothetical protein DUNSADRAFT_1198 [Dunaliella salina]
MYMLASSPGKLPTCRTGQTLHISIPRKRRVPFSSSLYNSRTSSLAAAPCNSIRSKRQIVVPSCTGERYQSLVHHALGDDINTYSSLPEILQACEFSPTAASIAPLKVLVLLSALAKQADRSGRGRKGEDRLEVVKAALALVQLLLQPTPVQLSLDRLFPPYYSVTSTPLQLDGGCKSTPLGMYHLFADHLGSDVISLLFQALAIIGRYDSRFGRAPEVQQLLALALAQFSASTCSYSEFESMDVAVRAIRACAAASFSGNLEGLTAALPVPFLCDKSGSSDLYRMFWKNQLGAEAFYELSDNGLRFPLLESFAELKAKGCELGEGKIAALMHKGVLVADYWKPSRQRNTVSSLVHRLWACGILGYSYRRFKSDLWLLLSKKKVSSDDLSKALHACEQVGFKDIEVEKLKLKHDAAKRRKRSPKKQAQ